MSPVTNPYPERVLAVTPPVTPPITPESVTGDEGVEVEIPSKFKGKSLSQFALIKTWEEMVKALGD